MILWRRRASGVWLENNETTLEQFAHRHLAVITLPGRRYAIVQVNCPTRSQAAKLVAKFGGGFKTVARNSPSQTQAHPPIRIGPRLQIVSSQQPVDQHRIQLVIPAAGAFGTGEHATTAMSLRLLAEIVKRLSTGWRLFDVGTGTGILALAARKLGAAATLGIDNDRRAVAHARRNAQLNRIGRARFAVADALRWKSVNRYDVITANLYSDLLIAALPRLQSSARSDGWLIASGILRQQTQSVLTALTEQGYRLQRLRRRGKWIALLCRYDH